jgi:glutathione S-transferase
MADELVFYTNPRSRGRIVRWMLEEVGDPYQTEVLDYRTTMKVPAYLASQSDGQGADAAAWRHGCNRGRRHLCLSCRCISASRSLAPPPGDSAARLLITGGCSSPPGPVEAAVSNKALRLCGAAGTRGESIGYGSFEAGHGHAGRSRVWSANYLVGDSFTAADVYAGSQIGFGLMFKHASKSGQPSSNIGNASARARPMRAPATSTRR